MELKIDTEDINFIIGFIKSKDDASLIVEKLRNNTKLSDDEFREINEAFDKSVPLIVKEIESHRLSGKYGSRANLKAAKDMEKALNNYTERWEDIKKKLRNNL